MSILDLFQVAVSRIQRHHHPFRGALALLAFVSLAAGSPLRAMTLQSASTNLLTDDSVPGGIQIASPAYGSSISGASVTIQFNLAPDKNADTLSVMVNGNDISSSFTDTPPTCSDNVCTVSGSITDTSVLKPGENLIVATVKANSGNSSSATNSTFSWVASAPDNGGQPLVNYYEPKSVGLSITPGGGSSGWVTVTTGTSASISDGFISQNMPALPNSNGITFIPYEDTTFSISCTTTYQAIVLYRAAPSKLSSQGTPEMTGCVSSEADMETQFQNVMGRGLDSRDLVIFGTAPGKTVPNTAAGALNTTSLGGTNYTKTLGSLNYPLSYVILGVKGKTAGSAYESFINSNTSTESLPPFTGTLTEDPNGNYDYIPARETEFQVISGVNPLVKLGATTCTPPSGSANGFWIMTFDRGTLQTQNSSGTFYSMDKGGQSNLVSQINSTDPNKLITLATVGCPFTSSTQITSDLANAIDSIGGAKYSLSSLISGISDCSYALMSVNDGNHKSITSNVAFSSGVFNINGEYGAIHGVLSPSHNGQYDITQKDQMAPVNGNSSFIPTVDGTFTAVSTAARQDWPLQDGEDTEARQALRMAYYDISYQLLTMANVSGAHAYDVRYFYTQADVLSSVADLVDTKLGLPGEPPPDTVITATTAWDTASDDVFNEVREELAKEILQASSASNYLLGTNGSNGLENALAGTSSSMIETAFTAVNSIGSDMNAAQAQTTADLSSVLNLVAAIGSTLSPMMDAEGELGPALGIFSGAMWTASAADSPFTNAQQGPESQYDIMFNNI